MEFMLDIKLIRENPELVKEAAKNKNVEVDIDRLLVLDGQVLKLKQELDELRAKRNQNADGMKGSKPGEEQIKLGKELKEETTELEVKLKPLEDEWQELMYKVPNIPEPEVPVGKSEEDNVAKEHFGQKPEFKFKPKNHWEIAQAKGWIDKERAAKVSGARFAYIKGAMFELQFALVSFVTARLTNKEWISLVLEEAGLSLEPKPFIPIIPPMMVKTKPFKGTARLSKEDQTYQIEGEELWMPVPNTAFVQCIWMKLCQMTSFRLDIWGMLRALGRRLGLTERTWREF